MIAFPRRRWSYAVLPLCLAGVLASCAPSPSVRGAEFEGVDGDRRALADLAGAPAILLFWRSDCAPCLNELQGLRELSDAAFGGRLVTVAVQDRASAAAYLGKIHAPRADAWAVRGDPSAALVAFNGPPPRLPLAVALDVQGRICQRHVGLLGTDRVRQWVRECS